MTVALVTNDFPPKLGGIQSYLWELWRRLPPHQVAVLTTPSSGDRRFDQAQRFRIQRSRQPVLLPTPGVARRIRRFVAEVDASFVLFDPVLPLGLLGPSCGRRYGVVVHGAELVVPGRLRLARPTLHRVLRSASLVVAAGSYVAEEARRLTADDVPVIDVPPGVDVARFRPLDRAARHAARDRFGLPREGRVVLSVSRLVPRKGMDVLIDAAAQLAPTRPDVMVVIAGHGRDAPRLRRRIQQRHAPVRLLGRVPDDELPSLYGCADVFAMLCRSRWSGLEQEGFGIVFLEAAACGVPAVAGASGGAADAVEHGVTGLVVDDPRHPPAAAGAIAALLDDGGRRASLGRAARRRAEERFDYDRLASALHDRLGELTRPR